MALYASGNPATKKALKQMAVDLNATKAGGGFWFYQEGPFGDGEHEMEPGQSFAFEGPHYPKPHTWYAKVSRKADGTLVVK
jgi:hypothetical protein